MWFFKSKDLRDYSCDSKNSWSFWNFSENARSVFVCFRFWSTELHEPAQWTFWLLALRPENFKISNPKISGTIHTIRIIFADPESTRASRDQFFLFFEFDRRKPTNEVHEVFVFSVRVDKILMLSKHLPLISLSLTGWPGFFLISCIQKKQFTSSARKSMGWTLDIVFSVNSQCLELPEPL